MSLCDVIQEKSVVNELPEGSCVLEGRPEWPEQGQLDFVNVSLRYRPSTAIVLKQLTFSVKPREKIGIIGRTGAGKSTIGLALSRIIELFTGSIKIDGVDISQVPLKVLRSKVTVIPQQPILFSGTLRFNLDPDE